jgi:hypothetical protein
VNCSVSARRGATALGELGPMCTAASRPQLITVRTACEASETACLPDPPAPAAMRWPRQSDCSRRGGPDDVTERDMIPIIASGLIKSTIPSRRRDRPRRGSCVPTCHGGCDTPKSTNDGDFFVELTAGARGRDFGSVRLGEVTKHTRRIPRCHTSRGESCWSSTSAAAP